MVGAVGARVSFEEGSMLLAELAAVTVDPKQVERHAEALGREVAGDEAQQTAPMDQTPLPPTLYLGMDGTGIPVRASEVVGRTGKQADGSAKTREVKLCTIWSAEGRDEEGRPERDRCSVSYSAVIESAAIPDASVVRSEFSQRVSAKQTDAGTAKRNAPPSSATQKPGSGTLRKNSFPKPSKSSAAFASKVILPKPKRGLKNDTPNWTKINSRRSWVRYVPFWNLPTRLENVTTTFAATGAACAIQVSMRSASAPLPGLSRQVAKLASLLDSNVPACIGQCWARMPSSRHVATFSVVDLRTSGSAGPLSNSPPSPA